MSNETKNEVKKLATQTVVIMDYLDKPSPYSTNIYPSEVVQKAIDEYNAVGHSQFGTVCESTFYGIDEPIGDGTIRIDRISHKVSNMRIEDGKWLADITVVDTYQGKFLKELMVADVVRFSSRGVGVLNEANMLTSYQLLEVAAVAKDGSANNN